MFVRSVSPSIVIALVACECPLCGGFIHCQAVGVSGLHKRGLVCLSCGGRHAVAKPSGPTKEACAVSERQRTRDIQSVINADVRRGRKR